MIQKVTYKFLFFDRLLCRPHSSASLTYYVTTFQDRKNKFIRSFFGRIYGLTILFRDLLNFNQGYLLLGGRGIENEQFVVGTYKVHTSQCGCDPSLNTQSCIRRPLCSTLKFENLSISLFTIHN